jgi:hypothetical protein
MVTGMVKEFINIITMVMVYINTSGTSISTMERNGENTINTGKRDGAMEGKGTGEKGGERITEDISIVGARSGEDITVDINVIGARNGENIIIINAATPRNIGKEETVEERGDIEEE